MTRVGSPASFLAAMLAATLTTFSTIAKAEPPPPSSAKQAAPAEGAAAIEKGPYLQALGATGVTIKIELSRPAPARVEVYAAGQRDPIASRSSEGERAFHTIRVEGLSPATAYEYLVDAGGSRSERGHFTTAPTDARPFRFIAYGDSRSNAEAHTAVVRAMETTPADFLVSTGDMVLNGGDPAEWRRLFAIEGPMLRDRCAFVAVGNHELYKGDPKGEVAFLRYFAGEQDGRPLTRLYSTFRWSNTRFFMLNAMDTWTGDERAWLRDELDRALHEPGLVHRIAVMHHGPFSSGPHGGNKALANGEVVAMMRERGVDLLIAGHDHIYERGEGGGLKYVITGGAGAPLYEKKADAPQTRRFEAAYHFVEIAVDGDRVSVTARRPSGAVLEQCGYQANGPWDCDTPAPTSHAATIPTDRPAEGPPRRARACGCAMPGDAGGAGGGAALAAAVAAAARKRRKRVESLGI